MGNIKSRYGIQNRRWELEEYMLVAPIVPSTGSLSFTKALPWPQRSGYQERNSEQEPVGVKEVTGMSNCHCPSSSCALSCLYGRPGLQISHLCLIENGRLDHPIHMPSQLRRFFRATFKSREQVLETFPVTSEKAPQNQIH